MKRKDNPTLRLCGIVLGLFHERGYLIHAAQKDKEISTFCGWVLNGGGEGEKCMLCIRNSAMGTKLDRALNVHACGSSYKAQIWYLGVNSLHDS